MSKLGIKTYSVSWLYQSREKGVVSSENASGIEALACEKPEKYGRPITNWTAREIADELEKRKIVKSISPRHVARL